MLTVDLALAGIGIGAVAALAGLGLLVTYRVTGVFNIAFGAIAMLAAYLLWQMVREWHWPLGLAAVFVLLIVCPVLGLVLERAVFRPLQRRGSAAAELLTASLGAFVVIVGAAFVVWGGQARLDAPSLAPVGSLELPGGTSIRYATLVDLAAIALVVIALAVMQRTSIGLRVKAVVEQRDLAELSSIDTGRISAGGWVVGSVLAGLAGVLLAPSLRLDPFSLTLVVLETMAVAVIAGLARPGRAVVAALVLGVAQAELTRYHLAGRQGPLLEALTANLFVVALLVSLLTLRRLDEPGGGQASIPRVSLRSDLPLPPGWWVPALMILAVPFVMSADQLRTAQQVPALAIILVSLVVVSGYSGQISLGQAGFAGLGALFAARLAGDQFPLIPDIPDVAAIFLGALLVVPVGLLTGWPAIRRRGLFLALTTFAVGAVLSRFVLDQAVFINGINIGPPARFATDDSFYAFELACLGAALLLVRNLHRGRLGRALVAMRDDEAGARVSGIDVRRLKVFVFAVSAGLAGLGGALLAASTRAFDPATFDPVQSLLWFAAVVVFGMDSAAGAILAAGLLIGLDAAFRPGVSTVVIGALAVLLGRFPGGVVASARRAAGLVGARLRPVETRPAVRLSPAGAAVAARVRR